MSEARPTSRPVSVLIDPDPAHVLNQAADFFHTRGADDRACQTRDQLGFSTTKPIVMTGHQAAWWHPGILAKYIACQKIAACLGAASADIVPDQDEVDFDEIQVPVLTADGRLARRSIAVTPSAETGLPASARPAFAPSTSTPIDAALPSVDSGVASLIEALRRHQDEPNAARQISKTLDDLRPSSAAPCPTIYASELHQTDSFRDLVRKLGADADTANETYNNAVAQFPQARIAPLFRAPSRGRYELPLWRLAPGEPRRAVYADELDDIPIEQIAPKALLMTGFVRLVACDLFIHGTGGGVYDSITELWFKDWLGQPLAPKLVVSATLTLPLEDDLPTPQDVQLAIWKSHRAQHHPAALGLADLQQQRDALRAEVDRAKVRDESPAAMFAALHAFLTDYRADHRNQLAELADRANRLKTRLAQREIADDRTWAFFQHEPAAIEALAGAVGHRLCPTPAIASAT